MGLFIIGALAPSGLISASALAFSLNMSFRLAGASFFYWYPGIHARSFLGDYPLSSPSLPAIHLYPFCCSPPGYFSRLSYLSPPFRVFYCIRLLPCDFAPALPLFHFIGSYGIFTFSCFCFLVGFLCIVHIST